jgi:hypothetical protein
MLTRGIALALVMVAGCFGPVRPRATPTAPETSTVALALRIGQEVTLHGRFDGPGKLADFIVLADGQAVYLMGDNAPHPSTTAYGVEIAVRGTLRHYVPPPDSQLPDSVAQLPEHYFIESTHVVP